MAVITVEPADKIYFVYNCMQTRLRGQYNGKWPISLVCVSRPLVTVIAAIVPTDTCKSHDLSNFSDVYIMFKNPHLFVS